MLSDVDPRMLERSLRELKGKLEERLKAISGQVGEMSKNLDARVARDVGDLRRELEPMLGRIRSGGQLAERRDKGAQVKDWKVDVETYTITPCMPDGSTGPSINLKPMFEKFFDENVGDR